MNFEQLYDTVERVNWKIVRATGKRLSWGVDEQILLIYKRIDMIMDECKRSTMGHAILMRMKPLVEEIADSIEVYSRAVALDPKIHQQFPQYLHDQAKMFGELLEQMQRPDIQRLTHRINTERTMELQLPVAVTAKLTEDDINKAMVVEADKIEKAKAELNLDDSTSVISWGTGIQRNVSQLNAQMLEGVKSNEAGEVGSELNKMVLQMRGLDFSKAAGSNEIGFFGKLMGKIAPMAEFIQSFETVKSQIDAVANKLERHKVELLKSVKQLDQLYAATLEYFRDLGNYVSAGEQILAELDAKHIPELKAKAEASGELIDAQNLNDLVAKRDSFERRVHDIKLTRTVVMQTLPQVRLVQNNDKDLVQKIDTQLINTIPMWESQLVIAVERWKMDEATKTTKAVSDLQNELLVKNAEALKQGNAAARREIERGVYDIESVKKANDLTIAMIEESIAITQEARAQRVLAANELVSAESKLKEALKKAS